MTRQRYIIALDKSVSITYLCSIIFLSMLMYLIVGIIIVYFLRRIIFMPIPGSTKANERKNRSNIEYTDYEEVDD